MQDNDPKHTSKRAVEFFNTNDINWWKTPPESPDLNPIENLWLKEFLRREVKPHSKEELFSGIQQFWLAVTPAKCTRYIRHLRKVIPRVIEVEGAQDARSSLNFIFTLLSLPHDCSMAVWQTAHVSSKRCGERHIVG